MPMNSWRKTLNILNIALLAYIWIFSTIEYFSLPDRIPLHFDFSGKPDSFGASYTVFLGAVIATLLYLLNRYLSGNPDSPLLNISDEMRKNKRLTSLFVMIITFYILLLFANMMMEVIFIAKGNYERLSPVSNVIIGLMFISIVAYFLYARKKVHIID